MPGQVFANGKFYEGQVAVWRCPSHCPWDICLWQAVAPKAEYLADYLLADNTVVMSSKGHGNSLMAGGEGIAQRTSSPVGMFGLPCRKCMIYK